MSFQGAKKLLSANLGQLSIWNRKNLAQNEDMYTYTYIYFIVRKGGSDPPLSGPHLLTQLVPLPIFKMFFPSPLFCSSLFKDILA